MNTKIRCYATKKAKKCNKRAFKKKKISLKKYKSIKNL